MSPPPQAKPIAKSWFLGEKWHYDYPGELVLIQLVWRTEKAYRGGVNWKSRNVLNSIDLNSPFCSGGQRRAWILRTRSLLEASKHLKFILSSLIVAKRNIIINFQPIYTIRSTNLNESDSMDGEVRPEIDPILYRLKWKSSVKWVEQKQVRKAK